MEGSMENEQLTVENLEEQISLGQDMVELLGDDRFIRVFEEKFIKAFAITNVHNMAAFNPEQRGRVHEKMIARSHFSNFCEMLVIEGKNAEAQLNDYNAQLAAGLEQQEDDAPEEV